MRRIKAEYVVLGNCATTVLVVSRLIAQGASVVLINPSPGFNVADLQASHGLGLWKAAYRKETGQALNDLFDELSSRLQEVFPAPVEQSGLKKGECWSILSSTPVHRQVTEELEREFFKIERKPWSSGQFRLVNRENVTTRMRQLGIDLTKVAQVGGAIVRNYSLFWDPIRMGFLLSQYISDKEKAATHSPSETPLHTFFGARIEGRYGRKLVLELQNSEEVSVESEGAILVLLTGELLPLVKNIVASCEEPWIQGVRKRRKEQHFAHIRMPNTSENIWLELGQASYCLRDSKELIASWMTGKGPDGLERVADESLRFFGPQTNADLTKLRRYFYLDWEWKIAQWKETSHQTFWGTSFEGDLFNVMELVWNLPRL